MKFTNLKSIEVKKRFDFNSVALRWRNKNKFGGNFGMNIYGVNVQNYEISGGYTADGILRRLRFGYIYQAGIPLSEDLIDEPLEFIHKGISKVGVK